jgi:ribonuclease HII
VLPARKNPEELEAGCDEAGRGCLAGPVYAAAVILPPDFKHSLLNDSKTLSAAEREILRSYIEEHALAFAVSYCTPAKIDQINILNASFRAMHLAIERLQLIPEKLLIDGNRFNPYANMPFECIVKGDACIGSIAAASVLAKTYRDAHMLRQHKKFTQYQWDKNKGYPTKIHRQAIQEYGPCRLHRRSFQLYPSPEQPRLF